MLTPHTDDPARKERLKEKAQDPTRFGYTGPRRHAARLTPEQVAGLQGDGKIAPKELAALKKQISGLEKEVETLTVSGDEAARAVDATVAIAALLHAGAELGKDGKPDVEQIAALLPPGTEFTAEDRDAIWERIIALMEQVPKPEGDGNSTGKGGKKSK